MKTIGLIGGISWESTATYYKLLNRMTQDRLGGVHSARILMWSFDFADIEALQVAGDWDQATALMIDKARRVEQAGADCLLICANTMHKMAPQVAGAIDIPLLHIADTTAEAIKASGATRPLLLATGYVMEQDFYKGRLKEKHGLDVLVPDADDRQVVHQVIFDELVRGIVSPGSKQAYLQIVQRGLDAGADSVIFGCTEIGMLLSPDDFTVPSFDTALLHATAAVDFALAD